MEMGGIPAAAAVPAPLDPPVASCSRSTIERSGARATAGVTSSPLSLRYGWNWGGRGVCAPLALGAAGVAVVARGVRHLRLALGVAAGLAVAVRGSAPRRARAGKRLFVTVVAVRVADLRIASAKSTLKWSVSGRLAPPGSRVGGVRLQLLVGRVAGAGLPSSASSVLMDSGGISVQIFQPTPSW